MNALGRRLFEKVLTPVKDSMSKLTDAADSIDVIFARPPHL